MGVDYKAFAVIGYKVSAEILQDNLIQKKKERLCEHQNQTGKFCSECGKPVWGECSNYYNVFEALDTLKIPIVCDNTEAVYYYIGTATENDKDCINLKALDQIKMEADEFMKTLGLNPSKFTFGVWAIQYTY